MYIELMKLIATISDVMSSIEKRQNLKVSFDILCKGQASPQGYIKGSDHLVFDV